MPSQEILDRLITRADAHAQGRTRYFTGMPCRAKGHVCDRYVSTGGCIECLGQYRGKFTRNGLTAELAAWRPGDAFHVPVGLSATQLEHLRLCMQAWVINWANSAGVPLTEKQTDSINKIVQAKLRGVEP